MNRLLTTPLLKAAPATGGSSFVSSGQSNDFPHPSHRTAPEQRRTMWFLLIQILFFMLLAAGLGAALAWWWLRRRFVDVTETHAQLSRQVEAALAEGRALTREDVKEEITGALNAHRLRDADLAPLLQRFDALASRQAWAEQASSSKLEARFQALSERLDQLVPRLLTELPQPDLTPLRQGLAALDERFAAFRIPDEDLAPLTARLDAVAAAISAIRIPEADLGPVHSGLARLELTLSQIELPELDLSQVCERLSGIQAEMPALDPRAELADLAGQLAALRGAIGDLDIPAGTDLSPVYARLTELGIDLSDRIAQIETRLTATAPINEALISTLAGMEADLNVVVARKGPDLDPVYGQLAAVDAALGSVRSELRALPRAELIERRLSALLETVSQRSGTDISRQDITALEDRLTALEYGVTALHHMLRARGELQPPRAETANGVSRPPAPDPAPRFDPASKSSRLKAIASAHRPDDEANLLTHAAFGERDELDRIVGVGPILTELLHEIGIFYFWQVAEWTDEDIAYVDAKLLHFRGRIERDNWVGQARRLSAEPSAARRPGAR
jgi:predicted flap endonuclease-1-like 5' DNA nuclease